MKIPIPGHVKVPQEAYKYWPEDEYIVHGKGKKLQRHIFEHQVLTEFENEKLSRLEAEIKDGFIENIEIPKDWSRNHLLRFCYGTGWKTRLAVKALVRYLKWRENKIPRGYQELYPRIYTLLV